MSARLQRAKAKSNPLTAAELWPLLKIQDKRDRIIPFVLNEAQQRFERERSGRDLVLKARQMGLSTYIQAAQFVAANTERTRCATLAHDDDATQMLRQMATRFWDNLPDDKRPPRGLDNATTTTYSTTGSSVFIATAGSKNKGRSGTYRDVHGSEVAFWIDAASTMAGLMQGVADGGRVVLESTPNGAQGWFYERCMEALDGNSDWKLHFYPWWIDSTYRLPLEPGEVLKYEDDEEQLVRLHGLTPEQIKWRRFKQRELKREFPQEYPEDARSCFLLSGESYFGPLEGVFEASFGAEYQPGHRYVAGLDFGQANDFTVLSIIDQTTLHQVALLRINKLPWDEMRRQIIELSRKWHVAALWAEENSLQTSNTEPLRDAGLPIIPFLTLPSTKPGLITGYHAALNEYGVKLLDDPAQRREHQAFVARQTSTGYWKYEAQAPEHDDTVMANAIACHGIFGGQVIRVGDAPDFLTDWRG